MSACAWNEGAQQNIVTITPKGSDSSTCSSSECSSSTGTSGHSSSLSRGAVAGIAIAALLGALILAAAFLFFFRRQRQKAAYKAVEPEPDISVLEGPVYNAVIPDLPHTNQSTLQAKFYSPDTVGDSLGGSRNGESSGEGIDRESSADERGLELDGRDTQINPVYHELPGSEVWRTELDPVSGVRRVPTSPSRDERNLEGDEPSESSPIVSTLGTMGWQDKRRDASEDLVSPITPVHGGARFT